jgi:hypothetical protein
MIVTLKDGSTNHYGKTVDGLDIAREEHAMKKKRQSLYMNYKEK